MPIHKLPASPIAMPEAAKALAKREAPRREDTSRPAQTTAGIGHNQGPPIARDAPELSALELERVLTMPEVVSLTGLSDDTLKRAHSDKIIQLSKRRRGMKVKHAIALHV